MKKIQKINPEDCTVLLIDHQSGLFQVVKDVPVTELRTNAIALAKIAALYNMPVITTASEPWGPNGPLMPEIHEVAPHAEYIARDGEINAWDREAFAEAVRNTGKKQLIIAGVITSVCVAFPTFSALSEGYEVFAVFDASGDPSSYSSQITLARIAQAGGIPMTTAAVLSEIQHTWRKPNANDFGKILASTMPHYIALIESFERAFDEGKKADQ
ncbi:MULTISPECIES: isochorismatase family protein [Chryseobacterium]|uniref:isochorismatase family protein n=1 Tax=Chryseobacterium TaxID=59732 RepID=UPI0016286B20|nr:MULTISPECIES: isochorismatase family protein [Chryseobacterium]MDM1556202.1 isochorismatase family protein [Chryseobacterium indologenes]